MEKNYKNLIEDLEKRGFFLEKVPSLLKMQKKVEFLLKHFQFNPVNVILIGGTNGKGTTSTLLSHFLSKKYSVGLNTSPHLFETTERISVNNQKISQIDFVQNFNELSQLLETDDLSHFEAITLLAFFTFLKSKLQKMIFEVGLGGKWDATNAIPHFHTGITSIQNDHLELLGPTLNDVLLNKIEIVREKAICVLGEIPMDLSPEQMKPKTKFIRAFSSPISPVFEQNLKIALKILEIIDFDLHQKTIQDPDFLKGYSNPGRKEWIENVCFDGSHNVDGIKRTFSEIQTEYTLFSLSKDKDFLSIQPLLPKNTLFTKNTLKPYDFSAQKNYIDDPKKAFEHLLKMKRDHEKILVTGSLYLVGTLRQHYLNLLGR